jgi:protein-S-isoprenylcysteine O-methyltransferase Ste14
MNLTMSLLGLTLGLWGAVVIAAYTRINARSRARGARAHWTLGAVTACVGMGSMFCGWGLLCAARPACRTLWLQVVGAAVCVLGSAVYAVSAWRVGRLRSIARYSLDLQTGGIYDRVRHPQAFALCTVALGLAPLSGSLPYLATLPLWLGFWIGYTYLEEAYELLPAFGAQYLQYRQRTPRLLPRWRSPRETTKDE